MTAWRTALEQELATAAIAIAGGEPARAFAHLERAHILSQREIWVHARVHGAMLRWGWSQRDGREVFGQVVRWVAALLFSRIWVPEGNTGGARVSALRRMPVPADLAALLGDRRYR